MRSIFQLSATKPKTKVILAILGYCVYIACGALGPTVVVPLGIR
jgi:hypothetical protein